MSNIEVKISEVKNLSAELGPCYNKVSSIADSINSARGNLDSRITARRNIGSRLSSAYNDAKSIQSKLKVLQKFIDESMNRYETADKKVEEQANALRILMDLRMRTGMEFDLISQMSGTSSAYVSENDKMFYDGEKVSDDEDIDEILKETDDLLKEVNEDDDNDWRNKSAKEDIFDKFADWLTEKVTGEKASPKTQGEEVIEAQLTSMSLDEQNILADIANDYQTAFRGLGSAERINEALENFEEMPSSSGEYYTKTVLRYTPTSGVELKATPNKTTTILGTYMDDTKNILDELGNVKSVDFGARNGEFNLLNTPDELYKTPNQFWNEYNKPWLDNVIIRGDIIKIATEPTYNNLYRVNNITGETELTGFGREFTYLKDNGYSYDPVTKSMIK